MALMGMSSPVSFFTTVASLALRCSFTARHLDCRSLSLASLRRPVSSSALLILKEGGQGGEGLGGEGQGGRAGEWQGGGCSSHTAEHAQRASLSLPHSLLASSSYVNHPPTHHASVPRVSVTREASSGLHHASQRRGVTPLVLFWNLLGNSL